QGAGDGDGVGLVAGVAVVEGPGGVEAASGASGVGAAVVLGEVVPALVAEDEREAVALVVGDGAVDVGVVGLGAVGVEVVAGDAGRRVEVALVVGVEVEAGGGRVVVAVLVDGDRHGGRRGGLADVVEGGGEAAGLVEGPVVGVVV